MRLRLAAVLAFAVTACTEIVEVPAPAEAGGDGSGGSAGQAGGGGGWQPADGNGGTAGAGEGGGGGAGGGIVDDRVACAEGRCDCARDCCGSTFTEPSELSPDRGWLCPPGYVDADSCDPATCTCDRAEMFSCVVGGCCRGDLSVGPNCVDGTWECPSGTDPWPACLTTTPCTCADLRVAPGDSCDEEGNLRCELTEETLDGSCDFIACSSCDGFAGPVEWNGCTCACDPAGGPVWCGSAE